MYQEFEWAKDRQVVKDAFRKAIGTPDGLARSGTAERSSPRGGTSSGFPFPKNAHISFLYQYKKMFSSEDIKNLDRRILLLRSKKALIDTVVLAKCNGHFLNWTIKKIFTSVK